MSSTSARSWLLSERELCNSHLPESRICSPSKPTLPIVPACTANPPNGSRPSPQRDGDAYTTQYFLPNAIPLNLHVQLGLSAGSDFAKPWYPQSPQNLRPESANVIPYPDGDFYPIGGTLKVGSSKRLKRF